MADHVLVIGAGSVGKRHMQNLQEQGCTVSAVDPRPDRLDEARTLVDLNYDFNALQQVEHLWDNFSGVVVATPPIFHVEQTITALNNNKPTLLEKPLTTTLGNAETLLNYTERSPTTPVLLGYTYRWWPPLNEFRNRLKRGVVGQAYHAKFVMSAHLADWHPWERYQDFFMASKHLGGGALLDESHFLDLLLWFFGAPRTIFAKVEKISNLEIETDDNVDIVASYSDGLRVFIHLDLYGRPHEKYISVTGEDGTLDWRFEPNCVRQCSTGAHDWTEEYYDLERNDMFAALTADFIKVMNGTGAIRCTVQDGVRVLRIIEACRESAKTGREIEIGWAD